MADLVTKLLLKTGLFDKNLAGATTKIKSFKSTVEKANGSFKSFLGGAGLGAYTKFAAAATAAAAFGAAVKKAAENGMVFELSLSHLRSLTGLSVESMEQLKQTALDTANAQKKAASEIVDAYGMIGSKMPELLKMPTALNSVTNSAITLSKAGLMSVEEAATSLTGIMNLMGAGAEEANKYINVLAAGSKMGAGNITYLSTAFDKCGTAVSNAGLSIELGTALLEVLAKKIPDASTAGTELRNVLLVMATGADNLNPKVVGLQTALENLRKISGNTAEMVKLFGKRNYDAAMQLAQNADVCEDLTKAVTGTSEAFDQASINTDNLSGSVTALKADWDNFLTSLGSSNGILKGVVDWIDTLILGLNYLFQTIDLKVEAGINTSYKLNLNSDNNQINFYVSKGKTRNLAIDLVILERKELAKINLENLKKNPNNGTYKANVEADKRSLEYLQQLKNTTPAPRRPALNPAASFNRYTGGGRHSSRHTGVGRHSSRHTGGVAATKPDTILEAYDKKIKELEEKKQVQIKAGLDTTEIDKQLQALKKEREEFKLKLIDSSDVQGLQDYLTLLKTLQAQSTNKEQWNKYLEQIEAVEDKIGAITGDIEIRIKEGSIEDIELLIAEIEEKIAKESNLSIRVDLTVQKEQLLDLKKEMEQALEPIYRPQRDDAKYNKVNRLDYSNTQAENLYKNYQDELSYYKDMIGYNKEAANSFKFTNSEIQAQEDRVNALKEAWENAKIDEDVYKYQKSISNLKADLIKDSVTGVADLASSWENLGKTLQGEGTIIEKFSAVINTLISTVESVNNIINLFKELSTTTQMLAAAKGALATSTAASAAATTSEAAASTANAAALGTETGAALANTTAKSGEAIAGATAAGASLPFPANIVAIAAGIAAVVAALAMISSFAFANGGIVGGTSYTGDKLLARVNSGEMVLNGRQQARLFSMINSGAGTGGLVEFKIKGKELVGVINNYNDKFNKVK